MFKPYIDRLDIKVMVRDAAKKIATIMSERGNQKTAFVCLLRGGIYYFTDLTRELGKYHITDITLEFLRVSSYTSNGEAGKVNIQGDIEQFAGMDVWLVDEIIDSGNTMIELCKAFRSLPKEKQPSGLFVTSLLCRASFTGSEKMNTLMETPIQGFVSPGRIDSDNWLMGYGMEDNGHNRNLPDIWIQYND